LESKHHANHFTGRKARRIAYITSTDLRKEEMAVGLQAIQEEQI
jgi:hypothetical protein